MIYRGTDLRGFQGDTVQGIEDWDGGAAADAE